MRKTLNTVQNYSQEPCQGVCLSWALPHPIASLYPS